MEAPVVTALRTALGETCVLAGQGHRTSATARTCSETAVRRRWRSCGPPTPPRSRRALAICNAAGVAVVTQGGRSGLVLSAACRIRAKSCCRPNA